MFTISNNLSPDSVIEIFEKRAQILIIFEVIAILEDHKKILYTMLPNYYPFYKQKCETKQLESLEFFKSKIKNWISHQCHWNRCCTYVPQIGYI